MENPAPKWKAAIRGAATSRPVGRAVKLATGGLVPSHGLRIDTRHPMIDVRTNAELLWGFYEKRELEFVRTRLRPDLDVIELGGSIGVTGSHILTRINPDRRLVTVEANPSLIEPLRANLERHGPGRYEIVHAAIDYSGATTVDIQITDAAVGSHVGRFVEGRPVPVPTVQLRDLVARLREPRYALFCDIEGGEHPLVQEDREALKGCEQMIVELHGWAERYEPTLHTLHELGFEQVARGRFVFVFERAS